MNEQYSLPSENSVLKPKKRSKLPYIIGGSAGGLALTIFVIIMVYKSGGTTNSTDKDSSVHTQSKKPPKGKNNGGNSLEGKLKPDQDSGTNSKDEPTSSSEEKEEEKENSVPNTEQSVNKNNALNSKSRGDQTKATNQRKAGKGNVSDANGDEDAMKTVEPITLPPADAIKPPTDPIKPPADPLKPFKSLKTSFVSNLKKAFLSNPDDEKLKTGYANLQNQLKHVLEKTPDFVDPDEVIKVSSTLTLDDFVKTSFTKQLEEIIQEYDKKLTEACKSNVAEYEALFNSWLAWIKRLEIDITGRVTPDWITFKSYPEAKKWCAKSNPGILSKNDIFLEELTALNITLPADPLKITPEFIMETIEEIEKKASGADPEAIKKASEKAKDVQKKYSDLIASDKSKADVFSRLMALAQAKSKASEIITKYKAELAPLLKGSKASDDLIARIQAAKNFDEISNIIIGEYKLEDGYFKFTDEELHNKLTMMHLEIMAKYFEVRNEDPSVVDSLNLLAKNVGNDKLSSYECAEAWGNVILKTKDIGDIRSYAYSLEKTKKSHQFSYISKFPYRLFKKNNEDNFNKLRELHQEKTLMLLSAKSAADALEKICGLDLELSTGKELSEYFENVGNFSTTDTIYHMSPGTYNDNGKILLAHIKEVVKRTVTKRPTGLDYDTTRHYLLQSYFGVPKKIAECLKKEKHSPDELQKWAEFATNYEMMMGSGLENNAANEEYFKAYRKLKEDFSKVNLTSFFDILLKNPEEFKGKNIAALILYNCATINEYILKDVVNALWEIKDGGKIAANIITLASVDDRNILSFMIYHGYKFPFFLGLLDDDVLRKVCNLQYGTTPVDFPENFDFKHTAEFKEFVESLKALQVKFDGHGFDDEAFNKLRSNVIMARPTFAPSIGFMEPGLKRYFPEESKKIIEAYKNLAAVISDTKFQARMNEEAASIQQAFDTYRIV